MSAENDYNFDCYMMIEEQLKMRDIKCEAVLSAMRNVPRHYFVPGELKQQAYNDHPLPIGLGQTISQPYIVAYMTEQLGLSRGMKVLEIGTGSGYQAAILAYMGCEVYTIDLMKEHAVRATQIFDSLGLYRISVRHGDGYLGWPDAAPFDAIMVTAAPERIPENLVAQLKEDGRMILPVGAVHSEQWLKLIAKKDGNLINMSLIPVRFVPMVTAEEGF
jgi:protein-L-isoaspartate(D-aspartate) O-methyltransferase